MLSEMIYKIRGISLIWKLLIPFAFFSFAGTTILVYIGLSSQEELIKKEEKTGLSNYYKLFLRHIAHTGENALAISATIANDLNVQRMMEARDREGLEAYLLPVFNKLKRDFGIKQFHFHVPPGKSFLRLHSPQEFGEEISYRRTILETIKSGTGVAGLEWGKTGLSIRGVSPIFKEGTLVGSVEIGYPFGPSLLNEIKKEWGPDFTVFEIKPKNEFTLLGTTHRRAYNHLTPEYISSFKGTEPFILVAPENNPDRSILLGPLKDYYGTVVALVQIDIDRTAINQRLSTTRRLMIIIGIAGIGISFFLVWIVSSLFTKPIEEIVLKAKEIAEGERETHLDPRPDDEIGMLTKSLNIMLDSLMERRKQVENYAKALEKKVEERTSDLVSSEEKYRMLVENLPLVVYRLLEDGTTEFVNPYFTEKLGYTAEEVVGNNKFWREKICGIDEGQEDDILQNCLEKGVNARGERIVKDKNGRQVIFIDHAIPRIDDRKGTKAIEGIMIDITELCS